MAEECTSKKIVYKYPQFCNVQRYKFISTPQTFRQLFNYSCLKYRDLLFMIFTLQNSITAV